MIVIMSKGALIEDVLIEELKKYLADVRFDELYPVIGSVRVSNEHPFALLLNQKSNGAVYDGQLFPSLTVVSGSDEKVPQLAEVHEWKACTLEPADVDQIAGAGYQIASGAFDWLKTYFTTHSALYGITGFGPRRDRMTIEVWSENIQLKNELYNLVELFLCGPRRVELDKAHGITVFEDTVRGQRSGNYNLDFGQILYGGQVSFEADYWVEQTILDSDLMELNDSVWAEVLHGKA